MKDGPISQVLVILAIFLGGCDTTTHQVRSVEPSGFLDDYSKLRPGGEDKAALRYLNPSADFSKYNKVLFEPVHVYVADDSAQPLFDETLAARTAVASDATLGRFSLRGTVANPMPRTSTVGNSTNGSALAPRYRSQFLSPTPKLRYTSFFERAAMEGQQAEATDSPPAVTPSEMQGADAEEMAKIGEAMANPLSYLWLIFMQNDTIWNEGDILDTLNKDAKAQNTSLFMPVLSMQLTEQWKTIFRPVVPINSFNTVDNVNASATNPGSTFGIDRERETGLGDIVLWTAFSNQYTPPWVWGFGPTIMLNTASDDQLGTGKNSAGPMALVFNITEQWILGAIAQHWWSFSGDDKFNVDTSLGSVRVDRSDVSLGARTCSIKSEVLIAATSMFARLVFSRNFM